MPLEIHSSSNTVHISPMSSDDGWFNFTPFCLLKMQVITAKFAIISLCLLTLFLLVVSCFFHEYHTGKMVQSDVLWQSQQTMLTLLSVFIVPGVKYRMMQPNWLWQSVTCSVRILLVDFRTRRFTCRRRERHMPGIEQQTSSHIRTVCTFGLLISHWYHGLVNDGSWITFLTWITTEQVIETWVNEIQFHCVASTGDAPSQVFSCLHHLAVLFSCSSVWWVCNGCNLVWSS